MSTATAALRWSLDDVELIEPEHRYVHRPSGREVAGTTDTLRECGLGFAGFAPQSALDRGNVVHEATVLVDEDDLDWSSVPEEWHGYVRAWERYKRVTEFRPTHAEWRFWHPRFWFAGTADRFGFKKGRRGGVEIKTGSYRHVWAQCGAYDRGWSFWHPDKPLEWWECVVLNEDGTYRALELARDLPSVDEGFQDFAACLRVLARRNDP